MPLTAVSPNSPQIASGQASPVGVPPADTTVDNIFYHLDGAGSVLGVYYWDVAGQAWSVASNAGANFSEGLVAGWQGRHKAKHDAPVPTEVSLPSALTPRFSVALPSASSIPFDMFDQASGSPVLVATGVFPANAVHADAATCNLVDGSGNAVTTLLFAPSLAAPVAHFAVKPVGGHSAMPNDGETFMVHLSSVY